MKICVFSDSHGHYFAMRSVLDDLENDCDFAVHLGDGAREFARISAFYPTIGFVFVRGNCDYDLPTGYENTEKIKICDFDGIKMLLCHGNTLSVGSDLSALAFSAAESDAKIALFGHTHIPNIKKIAIKTPTRVHENAEIESILCFNPGSISLPRGGYPPSYGIIEISDHPPTKTPPETPTDSTTIKIDNKFVSFQIKFYEN